MSPRVRLALLAGACVALFVVVLLSVGRSVSDVRDAVDGAGAWAPLAMVGVAALLTVAFFPFPLVAAASGVLFGTFEGTLLAAVGELLGACVSFLVARRLGREAVVELAGPRIEKVLEGVGERGFVAVLYVRILPGVPRHPANYAFGLTPVALLPFAAATFVGTLPRAFGYAALGGTLGNLDSPESIAAIGVMAAMLVLGLVLLVRERRRARAAGSAAATSSPAGRSAGPP